MRPVREDLAVSVALVNHVGLTTPDIYATIDWYEDVLGFELIMGPRVLEAGEAGRIYGERFVKAYQAHLLSANGVGIELFEFVDPPVQAAEVELQYARRGFFHLCLTVDDVAATGDRIVAAGGTRVNDPFAFVSGRPWQLSYCRDPWGTTLELLSASYAQVFANWPQPGATSEVRVLQRDGSEREAPPGRGFSAGRSGNAD
jgi:catechol 2,3-dioxygenase-like lactoylglutathione lyase family enzyme